MMALQDRDSASGHDGQQGFGRPGGDWQGMRPTLDNPLTWSLPLGRLWGIAIRVHVIFLIYAIIRLLQSTTGAQDAAQHQALDLPHTALWLGVLALLVLLHEFGHCAACRWTDGEADEVLLWPLGGLAYCRPTPRWSAHLTTAVGGPLVNALICLILTPIIGLTTGQWWGAAFPNPLNIVIPVEANNWLLITLYLMNTASFVLLWFNLLPLFPLDGGRILQACLWPRLGYARSMRVAVRIGYVGAILLGILGVVTYNLMLVAVAFFGGMTCWYTNRQLAFTQEVMGYEPEPYGDLSAAESRRAEKSLRRAERQEAKAIAEAAALDRVLQKIAASGLHSLTRAERKLLKGATERQRKSGRH